MFELYECAKPIDKESSSIETVLLDLFGLFEMFICVDGCFVFLMNLTYPDAVSFLMEQV